MSSLLAAMAPVPYRELTGTQLLACQLSRHATIRCGVAATTLTLWHVWPWFEKNCLDESGPVAELRDYKGWRWIAADIIDRCLAVGLAEIAYRSSPALQRMFPSSVHQMNFIDGILVAYVPTPLSLLPRIPTAEYKAFTAEDAHVFLLPDLMSIVRTRATSLLGILGSWATNQSSLPLAPQLFRWALDGCGRLAGSWLSTWITQRVFTSHPLLVSMFTYLGVTVAFLWATNQVSNAVQAAYVERTLVKARRAHFDRLVEDIEVRNAETRAMLDEERRMAAARRAAAELEEEFPLERMETTQLGELREAAQAVAGSVSASNAARLQAMRAMHLLMLYEDAISRGDMERGAASVLDSVSRQFKYDASAGAESSVSGLACTTVTESGHSHTSQCAVCIESYADGDELIELVCGHIFHDACIREWLNRHKQCPMCRHDVRAAANESMVAPAYTTAQIIQHKLREWSAARLPESVANANWGTVADYARTSGDRVPESILTTLERDFEQFTRGGNTGVALLVSAVCGFLEVCPPTFESV